MEEVPCRGGANPFGILGVCGRNRESLCLTRVWMLIKLVVGLELLVTPSHGFELI